MIVSASHCNTTAPDNALHDAFLALLPKIQTHAQICFRDIRCPQKKADKIAEAVALAWKWFLRLQERGKDINNFKMVFVFLVARAVKSGRRLTGMEKTQDVLSELAQRRNNFKVQSIHASAPGHHDDLHCAKMQDVLEERLCDNTVTPPPDAAAFRIDFPEWRLSWDKRDRKMIDLLMRDARTHEVANKFAISAGRVSQKRRAFHDDWLRFHGEEIRPVS